MTTNNKSDTKTVFKQQLEKIIKTRFSDNKPTESVRILILGGGFAGIEVLKSIQRKFNKSKSRNIEITLVSRDNSLLFTPMLAEVASGMIEIRHIVTS
jgi:NADH:ubiquinone reductase (H+-translocating)